MQHVLPDILAAVDVGELVALVLIDLSAAFDTVTIRFYFNVCGVHLALLRPCIVGLLPS